MYIYTGDHNLRAESPAPGERGPLIAPFEPFECTARWRDQWGRRSPIGRRIITVADYEQRLKTMTLSQLINECRRRDLKPSPADTSDAQWILRPQNAITELAAERGEVLKRYGLDRDEILALPLSEAMTAVTRHITKWICDDLDLTERELREGMAETLMTPIRAQMGVTEPVVNNVVVNIEDGDEPVSAESDDFDPSELDIEARRAWVLEQRQNKVSLKDIADAVGVSVSTVRNDLSVMRGEA